MPRETYISQFCIVYTILLSVRNITLGFKSCVICVLYCLVWWQKLIVEKTQFQIEGLGFRFIYYKLFNRIYAVFISEKIIVVTERSCVNGTNNS
jgi:hypothetical protein